MRTQWTLNIKNIRRTATKDVICQAEMQVVRFGRQKDRNAIRHFQWIDLTTNSTNASDSDLTTEPSLGRIALVALVCSIDIALQQSKEVQNQSKSWLLHPAGPVFAGLHLGSRPTHGRIHIQSNACKLNPTCKHQTGSDHSAKCSCPSN